MKPAAILLSIFLLAPPAAAISLEDQRHIYELGGQQRIDPGNSRAAPSLEAGVAFSANACTGFDPKIAVDAGMQQIEQLISTVKGIPATILASLPGYLVCRAKPALCELLQNYQQRFEGRFDVQVKQCQDAINDAMEGRNPLPDWIQVARSEEWQKESKKGKTPQDIIKSLPKAGNDGIPWIAGKRAGGRGQLQLQPVRQTMAAGWCYSSGEEMDCESSAAENEFTAAWAAPKEARAWIATVVGDVGLWIYDGAPAPQVIPGLGLIPRVRARTEIVEKTLNEALTKNPDDITDEEIEILSSTNNPMGRNVLRLLKADPGRDWLAERLANEIATRQVLDKAFLARRLLLVGSQEAHLSADEGTLKLFESKTKRLDGEIQHLLTEAAAQGGVATNVGLMILERGGVRGQGAANREKQPLDKSSKEIEE